MEHSELSSCSAGFAEERDAAAAMGLTTPLLEDAAWLSCVSETRREPVDAFCILLTGLNTPTLP